jgi:hypothetical protein
MQGEEVHVHVLTVSPLPRRREEEEDRGFRPEERREERLREIALGHRDFSCKTPGKFGSFSYGIA